MENNIIGELSTIATKDLREAALVLGKDEIRFLVDTYYQMQANRIAANNQVGSIQRQAAKNEQPPEPHRVLSWLAESNEYLENRIKYLLDKYTDSVPLGVWCKSICGIGPVITAGLITHIDITKAPTAGHIWAFAGLTEKEWAKGQKRPFNATLKKLCFLIGESFVKVSNNENDFYGKFYKQRKEWEIDQNEAGLRKEDAAKKLAKFNIGKSTDAYAAYSQGKLPPAHIHARARRYAVKMFLSHYHHAAYVLHYGKEPPVPYILAHGDHAHYIAPPNLHLISGTKNILSE